MILIVAALGEVRVSRLYGVERSAAEDAIERWQTDTLLWRSQIEYYGILYILKLQRIWDGRDRDITITFKAQPDAVDMSVDLEWTFPTQTKLEDSRLNSSFFDDGFLLLRQRFFVSGSDDILAHAVEPLVYNLARPLTTYSIDSILGRRSAAHVLLELLLASHDDEDVELRAQLYRSCIDMLDSFHSVFRNNYADLIIRRMCTDGSISASFVHEVFQKIDLTIVTPALAAFCLTRFFGQDTSTDRLLAETMRRLLEHTMNTRGTIDVDVEVEINLGLVEMGYDPLGEWSESTWRWKLRCLAATGRRPDLVRRGQWMLRHIYRPRGD